jgi:ketosteroid isomerase-like protein
MTAPAWIPRVFADIDRQDADAFAGIFTEDGAFQFGNLPPAVGREVVRATVAGFFGSIAGLRHELADAWDVPGAVVVVGRVTYTRHDGSELNVPFADVLRLRDGKVTLWQIFIDASLLYRAA